MTRPNAAMGLPPGDRDDAPLFPALTTPSVSPALPLDGLDEDMRIIAEAIAEAALAVSLLNRGNAEHSKLACHVGANKLHALITRGLVERVRHVTTTVKGRI